MESTRLAGHTLPNEGRILNYSISFNSPQEGSLAFSCGVESPDMPSANARKKWHREHKAAVRAAEEEAR